MNVDMTKNLTYAFCTTDGGPAIAVQKRGSVSERFSHGLENEYRSQIGRETWGDNNARGDNNIRGDDKVDIKVDKKVDNNVGNDTVKHPQTRTRTTTPYNTRTSPVQHPYKKRRYRLGRVMGRVRFFCGPVNGPLKDVVMNLIAEIPGVNRKDLVRRTGVSERTMTRSLSELERSGKIEHRGSKKTGGYYHAEGSSGNEKAI